MFANRLVALLGVAAVTIAAAITAWLIAVEAGKRRLEASLEQELGVLERSVESEIERFRYLPAVIGRDGRIVAALKAGDPAAIATANRYLTEIRALSQADELYVMTREGLTVAASNHGEPGSFVGQNYRFRPYFSDALAQGEGRYYAVGVTTGIPGYFLSSVIRDGNRVIGVAVAKVDMAELEAAWHQPDAPTALADEDGVVFLSGYRPWKYRPLTGLGEEVLAEIERTRKYDGIDLAAVRPIFAGIEIMPAQAVLEDRDEEFLLRSARLGPDEWRLIRAASLGPIYGGAHLVALTALLAGLLVYGTGVYVSQRRQLIRAKLDAHDRLEKRVEERTSELNREIEERRRAEAELREAQETLIQTAKLAALGRMSTAIVHEVSQPLSALENTLATAGVLAERGDAGAVGGKMKSARELVRRIQRTVRHLRSFARKDKGATEVVSVAQSIAAAVEIVQHRADQLGAAIAIDVPSSMKVAAGAVRLEQVILNLLVNALDAVSDVDAPAIEIAAAARDDMIEIAVRDNGRGIPADLAGRVSEPFFTTKQTGEGLGLGLSISRAIVGEFGGALSFRSSEGEGTTFLVALPAAQSAREAAE
ncbi:sensor histidine kinase [Mesorhizobium xinjiangense]|uniref:sensor histidine kinase n=1 Tax=Mesorhizobium xinjiangense TaxID=2678685 RepID=UPI0012EE1BE2|nr:ATP-binding protein [Mesorhizobium xinjiangense]